MKTLFKTKIAFLFILIGLSFSCKKNEPVSADTDTYVDSTETAIDSVDTTVDTTAVLVDTATVRRDSIAKAKK
ncbi:hypothetical protein ASF10_11040 [Flavobacterium sp. Leaf82]|uniref:hypothetical protein n=1 Tax=Flavobacterium sp. Leaf82 TaxID=1736238 RepID=UPI0006F7213C|nr:hypothetical protein [Flavobacterium sp. Leaf82]KQO22882.1 hypothetical protein ASF10_11040 [Flavobacterium sp. Leaf82]